MYLYIHVHNVHGILFLLDYGSRGHTRVHDKDQDTGERQSKATQTKSQGSVFSKTKIAALGET